MADITIPGIPNPNTIRFTGGAQPKFRYVHFAQDVVKGECQQWSTTNPGYQVEDSIANSMHPAGVACDTVDVSVWPWGWIQTGGFCDYVQGDGAVAVPSATPPAHDGDIFLVMNADEHAEGQALAELQAADVGTLPGRFAMNLLVADGDAGDPCTCILCCRYQ